MLTSNVFTRVFHVKYGVRTGTCFAIDIDNRQYLITARHVLDGLKDKTDFELYHDGIWKTFQARLVGHHASADITVIAINQALTKLKLEISSNGIFLGQDTYFLGFPYGLGDKANSKINRNFPLPLVKKATLSAILEECQVNYMILDGINNPGFSGGPVIFKELNQDTFKVAAIISGYRFSEEPVYQNGEQIKLSVRNNTGLIIAYNIENALSIINSNPIGFELQ